MGMTTEVTDVLDEVLLMGLPAASPGSLCCMLTTL